MNDLSFDEPIVNDTRVMQISNIQGTCNRCNTGEGYLLQAMKDGILCYLCIGCMFREKLNLETDQAILDVLVEDKEYKDIFYDFNDKKKQPS